MKGIKDTLTVVFLLGLLLINSTSISAQKIEGPMIFDLGETHSMSVITEGSLIWQEDVSQKIEINITLESFPTNNSEINIQVIQFFTIETGTISSVGSSSINTTAISLSPTNRSTTIVQEILPHESADRFYINITIFASPKGGGADTDANNYSYRFPESESIIVERDNLVPVVNLYGFPSNSFFKNWIPIYLAALFFILSPGLIVGIDKLISRKDKETIEAEESDDNNRDESEVIEDQLTGE